MLLACSPTKPFVYVLPWLLGATGSEPESDGPPCCGELRAAQTCGVPGWSVWLVHWHSGRGGTSLCLRMFGTHLAHGLLFSGLVEVG